eukprot:797684-Rhodomonas_salina.1
MQWQIPTSHARLSKLHGSWSPHHVPRQHRTPRSKRRTRQMVDRNATSVSIPAAPVAQIPTWFATSGPDKAELARLGVSERT